MQEIVGGDDRRHGTGRIAGPDPRRRGASRVTDARAFPDPGPPGGAATGEHPGPGDPGAVLGAAVEVLAGSDPEALGDAGLAGAVLALRRAMDRLDGIFARWAAAANARGIGTDGAGGSTAGWLAREAGMRVGDAQAAITAGGVCQLLTATGDAWRSGEISTAAFRTIAGARVEGHDDRLVACEGVLLGLARRADMRGLRRAAAHFRNLAYADGTRPPVPDGLHLSRAWAGRTVLTGEFGDAAAETLATALHAYADPPEHHRPRPASQRYADALVRIAEAALEALPGGGRPRAQVSVVVDWATLTQGRPGRLDGDFTGPIHPSDVRRLLCDCDLSRVVTGPDGIPVDVGRTSRTVPPATRRALVARDGGCRFPRCDRPAGWCDAHHVHHWADGGATDLQNLVLLCDRHHRAVHHNRWRVELDRDGVLRIRGPDGARVG